MKKRIVLFLALAALVLTFPLVTGSQDEKPAEQTDAANSAKAEAEAKAAAEADLERFVPTEELSADSAVSFPVDI
jgi:hypothetical protein